MSEIKMIEGDFQTGKGRYVIVVGRFNSFVVDSLLTGALDTLKRHGVAESQITVVKVPGAYEMPLAVKKVLGSMPCDAVIALGAVIRGGTPHFDYVANECTKGIAQASLDFGKPVSFGVLTTDTIEQAVERSGTKAGNKGAEAAMAAIEMVSLFQKFDEFG